jgi:hypothetical protein
LSAVFAACPLYLSNLIIAVLVVLLLTYVIQPASLRLFRAWLSPMPPLPPLLPPKEQSTTPETLPEDARHMQEEEVAEHVPHE